MEEDLLENISLEEIDEIFKNDESIYSCVKKYLIDYVDIVVGPLFREAAHFDSKYKRALSFATHVTTAVFTGATLYIYDRKSTNQNIKTHDIRLLCTALTLHDINKYWNEMTGSNHTGNYYELIRDYFDLDSFYLKKYNPDWEKDLNEIAFFIQHTQEYDSAQEQTRFTRPKYGKLLPYIKIGDKIASLGKLEYPLQEIHKRLNNGGFHAQLLLFPQITQQLFSQVVYRSIKKYLVDSEAVPLLISPQGIIYLAEKPIRISHSRLKEIISDSLIKQIDPEPILKWGIFRLDNFLSIPIDINSLFEIFVSSVKKKIEAGLLKDLGKTTYPEGKEIQESISCLAYFIYNDKCEKKLEDKNEGWSTFPKLDKFVPNELKEKLKVIGGVRKKFADRKDLDVQKCKVYTLYELINNQNKYLDVFNLLHSSLKEALLVEIHNDSSFLDSVVKLVCAYNGDESAKITDHKYPYGNSEVCFMCGSEAHTEYKPGKHFIQSGGFSKRATYKDQYKRCCETCQIEHQLINHLIEKSGFRRDEILMFFYFYFDSIFFNIDPFHKQIDNVEISVQGTKNEKLSMNFSLGDFETPFHIIPMAIRLPKKSDNSSKSTRRARAIHTAIKACLESGCKCVLTSPYTVLRTYDEMFYNEQPNTLEVNIGIDNVKSYKEAKMLDKQLSLINKMDGIKGLYRIQQFKRITVIPYIKRQMDHFESWVQKNGVELNELFGDNYMEMKEIAKKGVALFGKHRFTGSYKRVKIFRTTMDSLIVSKSQRYSDEEAVRFAAAKVSKDVMREQYSPKKGKDIETESIEFTQNVVDYLKEHGLWNVKKLAQWQNPLTDMYEFEYILATKK